MNRMTIIGVVVLNFACLTTAVLAQDQAVYEAGKEGDAPDPPTVTPLTEREICGDWKAEKVGPNEAPVDDLYIYIGDKGLTVE